MFAHCGIPSFPVLGMLLPCEQAGLFSLSVTEKVERSPALRSASPQESKAAHPRLSSPQGASPSQNYPVNPQKPDQRMFVFFSLVSYGHGLLCSKIELTKKWVPEVTGCCNKILKM